ncbi:MAG: sulfite exporter TauE/SafE family protein [Rhizobiales bacterium]|nr:sulfite exporter TauE/SafE family protein [Hyphomicrobiales bacterium]
MSLPIIAIASLLIFLAAIARGYSGFGFSLLAITSLSLVLKPAEIVPSIFMLEIAASLHLLPGIWREVHWRSLVPLIAGCLVATPFGVMLLASAPPAPMQLALSIFVLIATYLLWRGFALNRIPGTAGALAAGAAAGFGNGAFGIAGPPVILFYFSSPAGHAMGRASLIAFFLATDLIGLPLLAREGLVTADAFYRAVIFLVPLISGVWLGARGFKTADPVRFRQIVLILLAFLAILIAGKALSVLLA